MSDNSFIVPFEDLPNLLPIFPLSNAIVMPGCHLPLNIFEPRYVEMMLDSLGQSRLIGMIQPETTGSEDAGLYMTGTAGRIVSFNELPERKLIVVLLGVSRFDIKSETASKRSYRTVEVDWSRFREDFDIPTEDTSGFDRERLIMLLKDYFERKGFNTNWSALEEMPVPLLVDTLAGQLPLASPEKQALVETVSTEERVTRFIHLIEFDAAAGKSPAPALIH